MPSRHVKSPDPQIRMHSLVDLRRISAFEKTLDCFSQVGQRVVFGIALTHHFEFNALGNVSVIFGPYPCCQSHAATLLHPGRSCIRDHRSSFIGACVSSPRLDHHVTHVDCIHGRLLLACVAPKDQVRIYVPLHARCVFTQRVQFTHVSRTKHRVRETSPLRSSSFPNPILLRSPQHRATSNVASRSPSFVRRESNRAWHALRKGTSRNGAAEINRVAPTPSKKNLEESRP